MLEAFPVRMVKVWAIRLVSIFASGFLEVESMDNLVFREMGIWDSAEEFVEGRGLGWCVSFVLFRVCGFEFDG